MCACIQQYAITSAVTKQILIQRDVVGLLYYVYVTFFQAIEFSTFVGQAIYLQS